MDHESLSSSESLWRIPDPCDPEWYDKNFLVQEILQDVPLKSFLLTSNTTTSLSIPLPSWTKDHYLEVKKTTLWTIQFFEHPVHNQSTHRDIPPCTIKDGAIVFSYEIFGIFLKYWLLTENFAKEVQQALDLQDMYNEKQELEKSLKKQLQQLKNI